MAKYIMLLKQEGEGCDYSIGCGMAWEVIETDDIQEKIKDVLVSYGSYSDGEVIFSRMVFVPFDTATVVDADLEKIYRQIKDKKNQQRDEESEKKEKEEYERLKEKYDKTNPQNTGKS